MRHWKRLFYYLIINVMVSACTVLLVLSLWDRARAPAIDELEINNSPQVIAQTERIPEIVTSTESIIDEGESNNEITAEPPEPVDSPVVSEYQVRTGDTLGAIASRFGVSIELLMEANNITDPNKVDVGQVLIIPQIEAPSATRTPIPTATMATSTPQATVPPIETNGDAQVIIDSVIGAGDLNTERVMLKRIGSGALSMEGWQLREEGGLVFTFPQFKLFEAGAVYIYSRAGQPTSFQLFWGLEEDVWRSGEMVTVLDDQGQVRATYQVP